MSFSPLFCAFVGLLAVLSVVYGGKCGVQMPWGFVELPADTLLVGNVSFFFFNSREDFTATVVLSPCQPTSYVPPADQPVSSCGGSAFVPTSLTMFDADYNSCIEQFQFGSPSANATLDFTPKNISAPYNGVGVFAKCDPRRSEKRALTLDPYGRVSENSLIVGLGLRSSLFCRPK